MAWQTLLSSLFPTNQDFLQDHKNNNNNCDWPLVDHKYSNNINPKRTATTYGSGSLDATANGIMNNESSVLVANGDSELESGPDGVHKVHANGENENVENVIDAYCFSCTWKEYIFSWRFIELLVCVIPFTLLWRKFESNTLLPRMRPIPVGQIFTTDEGGETTTSNGDFWGWESPFDGDSGMVWNLVNTERFLGETIGHKEYQVLMGLLPWLLQLTLVFCLEARKGTRNWDALHRTTCMYFAGIGATDFITNCVKYYVGYLRPIFLDVCQPYYDESDSTFQCSNHAWNATDARMSFPSNHSGWSFCGMMLLSFFLEQNFGLSSYRRQLLAKGGAKRAQILVHRNWLAIYRLVSLLCYFPLLFAVFVAASRVVDNKHFPADVIGGALLGGSMATLVFGIWFPPPESGLI